MESLSYNMSGRWDAHLHPIPDLSDRVQSLGEVYRDASDAGMAGLVAKSHKGCTAGACFDVERVDDSSTRLVSSITLNEPAGGIDAEAVEQSAARGSQVVWFPTYCARHHLNVWGRAEGQMISKGLSVFDDIGRLSEETEHVLEVIADRDLVLCSGHIAPEETFALFRRARELGVQRMVLTHASEEVTRASEEIQAQCVGLGALIEHCFMAATACCPGNISFQQLAWEIRRSGVDNVVLSSDFGQKENGPIVASFALQLARLSEQGFSESEIEKMTVANPETILG